MKDLKKEIGKKIKVARLNRGITQADICDDESELTIRQLIRIENGQAMPTIPKLMTLSKKLGISIQNIVDVENIEISKEYMKLKAELINFPTYADEDRIKHKEDILEIISENYYDNLPEEEQLFVDVFQARFDIYGSLDVSYGLVLLEEYFQQILKRSSFNINDLLIIELYFFCCTIGLEDTTLDSSNIGYSIYQNYKNQSSSDNSNVLKSQSIAQIDSQISQMENNLSNYRVQYAGSGAQQAYSSSLDSQLESLRSQQLSRVGQELGNINQKIIEAETGKNVQTNIVQKSKIFAPEDGIVHLNPETSNSVIVPEGNLIAQLYPLLTTEKKVKITAYISSKDIAQIKVGDRIRFTTIDNLSKQQNLTSTISSIDTSATKTEKGSFFKVEAETKLTDQEAKKIRYGLEGRIVMITGKKSYFQYYLDQFLKKN